jgi:hypothetical protein
VTDLEQGALATLRSIVASFGAEVVQAVLNDLFGTGGGMLIEDVSLFVGAVLRAIIEVTDESRVRAEVEALFRAGDLAADAADEKRFGPR